MDRKEGKDYSFRKMIYAKVKDNLKDKTKEEIIDDYIELLKEKDKIERELKKYKNCNTPSSQNKHLKDTTQGFKAKRGAKRGAPKDHKGNTLRLTPNKIINLITKLCRECGSLNIKPTGYVKKRL